MRPAEHEHLAWVGKVALAALALVFLLSGLYQAAHDSATVDEAVDVASGVTGLARHDLRLSPEHDLLIHVLPSAPALLARPVIPDGPGYRLDDWFAHTDEFMRANRAAGKLGRILFLARLAPLLEGLGVAAALYHLTRRLLGVRSGVLASALWLTTPVFLGFSHLVSIDVTFTLVVLLLGMALCRDQSERSYGSAAEVGVALGATLLARHSGLVLVPAVAVSVWRARRGRDGRSVVQTVGLAWAVAWMTVWAAFVAFGSALNPVASNRFDGLIGAERSHSVLVRLALSVPWPKEWAAGLAYLAMSSTARPAYLLGQAWSGGRWWFFPGSLLVKAPLGVVLVFVVLPVSLWRIDRGVRHRVMIVLLPMIAALSLQLVVQPLDLGLRYAFPVVALGLVVASSAAIWLRRRAAWIALAALAVPQSWALIAAIPHSVAWTPPPFSAGYRWASDSNIDYGQDEAAVERWAIGKTPLVSLLLPRGVDDPAGSKRLLVSDPTAIRGWVAVSATRLTVLDRDALSWLRAYCPTASINGSVLVYRFAGPPDTRPGPQAPRAECRSTFSHRD